MSEETNTPPAFFKAPAVTAPVEVLKALLVYQKAKGAYEAKESAFKRTKAGYIRESDMPAHADAQGIFYREANAAWMTIHKWADEVATLHATTYFQSLLAAFLDFANDHAEARKTKTIQAATGFIKDNGGHVSRLFTYNCSPDWVDVAFGSMRYKAAIRLENPVVNSVDFYEIQDGDRVSGFHDVSARMKYQQIDESLRHPLVKVSNEEFSPTNAESYADLIKEAATLASALSDFNNLHVGEYSLYEHRSELVNEALTIPLGDIDEPVNPDEA
jgi:hypothetical protein